jgi:hypothetical protein
MGLLRKMRILVGALIHRPFMPRPEKAGPESSPERADTNEALPPLEAQVSGEIEEERVADLIAAKREEAGNASGAAESSPGSRD